MRKFFKDLREGLDGVCPAFLHLPEDISYPHITLEEISSLSGIPHGPTVVSFHLKVWSRYAGTKEILKLLKNVETFLRDYQNAQTKILKSFLVLLEDRRTRVHTLHIKARVPYERD